MRATGAKRFWGEKRKRHHAPRFIDVPLLVLVHRPRRRQMSLRTPEAGRAMVVQPRSTRRRRQKAARSNKYNLQDTGRRSHRRRHSFRSLLQNGHIVSTGSRLKRKPVMDERDFGPRLVFVVAAWDSALLQRMFGQARVLQQHSTCTVPTYKLYGFICYYAMHIRTATSLSHPATFACT